VAMLLRDVMTPLPLRDGRGEDMVWALSGSAGRGGGRVPLAGF